MTYEYTKEYYTILLLCCLVQILPKTDNFAICKSMHIQHELYCTSAALFVFALFTLPPNSQIKDCSRCENFPVVMFGGEK